MPTYIALLRGINVGGHNKIAMADFRELLTGLGHAGVRTHILSGNAIFTSKRRSIGPMQTEIEVTIHERFGLRIAVQIRTADEFAAIVAANPLPEAMAQGDRLFVLFLDRNAEPARIDAIDKAAVAPDEFHIGDRVIYAWYRNGVIDSKLASMLTDKRLGVGMTGRNWNTVTKLLELARKFA